MEKHNVILPNATYSPSVDVVSNSSSLYACMLVVVASSLVSHGGTRRSGLSLFVVVVIVSIVIGQFLDLSRARGISSVGRARA